MLEAVVDELAAVLEPLARSRNLVGASIADLRADLDHDGGCAARLVALLDGTL